MNAVHMVAPSGGCDLVVPHPRQTIDTSIELSGPTESRVSAQTQVNSTVG